jgi:nucleoside 2-deoxyribosyltransferase
MEITIYFAAPLFTQAERFWNIKLAEALTRKGPNLKIILPQQISLQAKIGEDYNFNRLFNICIQGIEICDVILAVLDGADSDSGTCFECGYGFAKGKRLIGVRTDLRKGEDQDLNAMLSQSCEIISFGAINDTEEDIDKIADMLIAKINNDDTNC